MAGQRQREGWNAYPLARRRSVDPAWKIRTDNALVVAYLCGGGTTGIDDFGFSTQPAVSLILRRHRVQGQTKVTDVDRKEPHGTRLCLPLPGEHSLRLRPPGTNQALELLLLDRFSDGRERGWLIQIQPGPSGHEWQHAALQAGRKIAVLITTPGSVPATAGRVGSELDLQSKLGNRADSESPRDGSVRSSGRSLSSRLTTVTASRTFSTLTLISGRERSFATLSRPPTSRESTSSSTSSPTIPATFPATPLTGTLHETQSSGRWYNDPRWDGRPYAVQGL